MKRLTMIAVSVMALAGVALAEWYGGTLTVEAGSTNAAVSFMATKAFGPSSAELDRVVFYNESGAGTGAVVFAAYDFGYEDALYVGTGATAGTLKKDAPVRTTITGTTTNYLPYTVRQLRVRVGQGAVADDTVYRWGVFTK